MPCHYPLQAISADRVDGKKTLLFSKGLSEAFRKGTLAKTDDVVSVPCGRCSGCRVERARQWAVRIMHEASLYEDNCFVTLTFDEEHLKQKCPDGSISRVHMQNFMKALRKKFFDRKIRVFYCGEYGENLGRPHYHACLFNVDFPDKYFAFRSADFDYYYSDILKKVWTYGNAPISELTFDSAAYVARYCTKKINGPAADAHYQGRTPEFSQGSLKPGIAHDWLVKYGQSDVFAYDELIVRGVRCKPPRYYDKFLEKLDPVRFAKMKELRLARAVSKADDNTYERLLVKEKCHAERMKKLVRRLELV